MSDSVETEAFLKMDIEQLEFHIIELKRRIQIWESYNWMLVFRHRRTADLRYLCTHNIFLDKIEDAHCDIEMFEARRKELVMEKLSAAEAQHRATTSSSLAPPASPVGEVMWSSSERSDENDLDWFAVDHSGAVASETASADDKNNDGTINDGGTQNDDYSMVRFDDEAINHSLMELSEYDVNIDGVNVCDTENTSEN